MRIAVGYSVHNLTHTHPHTLSLSHTHTQHRY